MPLNEEKVWEKRVGYEITGFLKRDKAFAHRKNTCLVTMVEVCHILTAGNNIPTIAGLLKLSLAMGFSKKYCCINSSELREY